jgi:ABC-type bacteriocin/lantibiotic exporter with double-glycine peptidase domain
LQGFQYNVQSLNNLLIDSVKFNKTDNKHKLKINFQKRISFKNVSFTYNLKNNNNDNYILKDINLEIYRGSKIGIVGVSGSGKSTFLDVLMGLLAPTNGFISVDDKDIKSCESGWQKNIGCVPQDVFVLDDSLKVNLFKP